MLHMNTMSSMDSCLFHYPSKATSWSSWLAQATPSNHKVPSAAKMVRRYEQHIYIYMKAGSSEFNSCHWKSRLWSFNKDITWGYIRITNHLTDGVNYVWSRSRMYWLQVIIANPTFQHLPTRQDSSWCLFGSHEINALHEANPNPWYGHEHRIRQWKLGSLLENHWEIAHSHPTLVRELQT